MRKDNGITYRYLITAKHKFSISVCRSDSNGIFLQVNIHDSLSLGHQQPMSPKGEHIEIESRASTLSTYRSPPQKR